MKFFIDTADIPEIEKLIPSGLIDGVTTNPSLIAKSGKEYHAIQCKYHSNKNASVTNKEVATFTSLLANKTKLSHGYICSTAIKTSANYNKLNINNVSNTNSLREYVDVEVSKIKKELKIHLPKVNDKITNIKLTESINQINNLTKGKVVDEKQVLTLMRYYELIKEIKNVHKT